MSFTDWAPSPTSARVVAVIDLGELPAQVAEAEPPPPRSLGRRGRLAVLAAVIAALLSASAVPVVLGLPIAARIPIGTYAQLLVQGTTAVVMDTRDGYSQVSAYQLRSGRTEWVTRLGGEALNASMFVDGSILIVETGRSGEPDEVEGFALSTGVRQWAEPASMVQQIPSGLLIYRQDPAGDLLLELFDPTAGARLWRTSISDYCQTYLSSDPSELLTSGLVELCADTKQIVAMDLATGESRARRPIGLFPSPRARHGVPYDGTNQARVLPRVVYVGAVTILAVTQYPALSLSAFRTSDLDPLWSGIPVTGNGRFYACGTDVCVGAGNATTALDPGTGRHVEPPAGGPAAAQDAGVSEGASIFAPAAGTMTTLVVVPAGQAPARASGPGVAYFETPTAQGQAISLGGPRTGSTWIAIQDGKSIQPVQLLRGVGNDSCSVVSTYVACTTSTHQLTVWKLP